MTDVDERPIVVGVDGSEAGLEAADWAADEAVRHGRRLRLVCAMTWDPYEAVTPPVTAGSGGSEEAAQEILAEASERVAARQPTVDVTTEVSLGEPVTTLTAEAREAYLVVTGSRGRGPLTRMLLGTVSLGVAARASCPVVVVRGEPENRQGRFGRIVVGVDAEEHAATAVGFAFREAEVRDVPLTAVHAWRAGHTGAGDGAGPPDAADVFGGVVADAAAVHAGVRLHRETIEGSPRQVLLRQAETADLLIVGAHHRRGVIGLRLGLLSHALLHHSPCPVAVVPQP